MSFLLTEYIYPIQEEIMLSDKYKFSLDNPRTEEEINLIVNYITKSYDFSLDSDYFMGGPRIPIYDDENYPNIATIEKSLSEFIKNYSNVDGYVNEFAEQNKTNNPLETIGKMWVIARFDDENESEKLKQQFEQIQIEDPDRKHFIILDDDNPLVSNSKKLLDYSYILTFLYHSDKENYNDQSFIAQKHYEDLRYIKIDTIINNCILMFTFRAYSNTCHHESDRWRRFFHIKEDIIKVSGQLEKLFSESMEEKLLYIADTLRVVGEDMKDQRHILLTLTGIIELLLTHSPNYNRFNVEDSISKQFKLKASILIYLNDKTRDIEQIKKRLGEIYDQRSNIAHGNFKILKKYIDKELAVLQKSDSDAEESYVLEYLNKDHRIYLRAILEEIIKDETLVNFMKEN